MSNISRGTFLTAAESVNANTTKVMNTTGGTDVRCERLRRIAVSLKFTGANAGSAGTVTFNFQTKVGDGGWSTELITISASLTATTAVVGIGKIIDVDGFSSIRLYSVTNADSTYGLTGVNADYGKAYGERDLNDGN